MERERRVWANMFCSLGHFLFWLHKGRIENSPQGPMSLVGGRVSKGKSHTDFLLSKPPTQSCPYTWKLGWRSKAPATWKPHAPRSPSSTKVSSSSYFPPPSWPPASPSQEENLEFRTQISHILRKPIHVAWTNVVKSHVYASTLLLSLLHSTSGDERCGVRAGVQRDPLQLCL